MRSTSVIKKITYRDDLIEYSTFDSKSNEVLRLSNKPKSINVNGKAIPETEDSNKIGWTWKQLDEGGVLKLNHSGGENIHITF